MSRRANAERVVVFDSLDLAEAKTKPVSELLGKLGIGSALFVLPEANSNVE